MGAQLALCVFTICLVTHETLGLVWSLGRRFIWFGHSGDAWSGLVTWETLGLVWSLGWRLVWFGHSEDAWSGLVTRVTLGLVWSLGWRLVWFGHSGGVRGCVMIIVKTLSGFNYSGDVVWFDPLRRRVVLVTSLRRRNETLTWLSTGPTWTTNRQKKSCLTWPNSGDNCPSKLFKVYKVLFISGYILYGNFSELMCPLWSLTPLTSMWRNSSVGLTIKYDNFFLKILHCFGRLASMWLWGVLIMNFWRQTATKQKKR